MFIPVAPLIIAQGIVGGAFVGAVAGGAVGGATGYAYDYNKAGTGLYEYNIICENEKLYNIRKIDKKPLEVNNKVHFYWTKDVPNIRLISEDKNTN